MVGVEVADGSKHLIYRKAVGSNHGWFGTTGDPELPRQE